MSEETKPDIIMLSETEADILQANLTEIRRLQRETDKIMTISLAARGHRGSVAKFDYSTRTLTVIPEQKKDG